jgi:cytidylate kinase
MAKITIFGLAGTGTSSVGKKLAAKLGYTYFSSGQLFRKKAEELSLDVYAFDALCNTDPKYDVELDKAIEAFGKENNDFVVESRLAWYFIPDSIKIKLVCDFDERVRRVAGRDRVTIEYARDKTITREFDGVMRYAKTYGIEDFAPDATFNLVIDSTHTPVQEIVDRIAALVSDLTKK